MISCSFLNVAWPRVLVPASTLKPWKVDRTPSKAVEGIYDCKFGTDHDQDRACKVPAEGTAGLAARERFNVRDRLSG